MSAVTGIELADASRQGGHRRVAGEGHLARDRLDEAQRQCVHVGLVVDLEAEGLFGRRVTGDMRGKRGRLFPRFGAEQSGHREVDDPEAGIVAEHQLRRSQFGVDDAAGVRGIERPAGFEPDHERLRRLEETPPVEQIAQAAAAEVLDHPEHRGLAVQLDLAPVEDLGDVGMRQRHGDLDLPAEVVAERSMQRPFRPDDLQRDRDVVGDIDGLGDDRIRTGGHHILDAVSISDHPADETVTARLGWFRHVVGFRHLVVHSLETLPPAHLALAAGIMEE